MNAAEGLLAVWHDVAAGHEAEVTHWYNVEHHPERLGVEGFLQANRYRLAGGEGTQFLSLYRTRSPAVLTSAAYRARLASPSEWTQKIMPLYRNVTRSVFRLSLARGLPQGGSIATLAGTSAPAGWDVEKLFESLLQSSGVLRCRWLLAEAPATSANGTAEAALRGGADASVAWAAIVDANEPEDALGALEAMRNALRTHSATHSAAYRLVYSGPA
jgi:hypothetical protein